MNAFRISNVISAARAVRSGALFSTGSICAVLAKVLDGVAKRALKTALVASNPRQSNSRP
jgi:hypothetical protein